MLNNSSIKVKLLSTVIGSIIIVSVVMMLQSITSLKHEANIIIDESSSAAYKRIPKRK